MTPNDEAKQFLGTVAVGLVGKVASGSPVEQIVATLSRTKNYLIAQTEEANRLIAEIKRQVKDVGHPDNLYGLGPQSPWSIASALDDDGNAPGGR